MRLTDRDARARSGTSAAGANRGLIVDCRAHLFVARGLKRKDADRDSTERIKILEVAPGRAVEMVMGGEITHGPSIALILKAHHAGQEPG